MKKYILLIFILFGASQSFSQVLPVDSLERKQLIAMGYDIGKEDATSVLTVANNGMNKVAVTRDKDRLAVARYYTRKKLNEKDEFELMKIINRINNEVTYQLSLSETYLTVALYDFGPYDPKTFLKIVRMIEKADAMFDSNEGLLKLLN